MKKILLLSIVAISFVACHRKKEPLPRICSSKEVYKITDTIDVENCSENYTKVRWVLPDATKSTNEKVYFIPPFSGTYKFTIYVSNDDYVNEYETVKYITVNP